MADWLEGIARDAHAGIHDLLLPRVHKLLDSMRGQALAALAGRSELEVKVDRFEAQPTMPISEALQERLDNELESPRIRSLPTREWLRRVLALHNIAGSTLDETRRFLLGLLAVMPATAVSVLPWRVLAGSGRCLEELTSVATAAFEPRGKPAESGTGDGETLAPGAGKGEGPASDNSGIDSDKEPTKQVPGSALEYLCQVGADPIAAREALASRERQVRGIEG